MVLPSKKAGEDEKKNFFFSKMGRSQPPCNKNGWFLLDDKPLPVEKGETNGENLVFVQPLQKKEHGWFDGVTSMVDLSIVKNVIQSLKQTASLPLKMDILPKFNMEPENGSLE